MSSPNKGQWMKPGDALQRLKAKKRALKARINKDIRKQALESCNKSSQSRDATQKRSNPFRCGGDSSDSKRPRLESAVSEPEPSLDQTLFEILRSGAGDVRTAAREDGVARSAASFTGLVPAAKAEQPVFKSAQATAEEKDNTPKGVPDLPTDWGLKTNIRFLSRNPFAWTKVLKTLEEASAVTSCVRCLPLEQTQLDTSPNAQLQRHALFWQHPWLPWLQLFPRLGSRASGQRSLFIEPEMQQLLQAEWGESLRSLFQLLRSRQCPFFYVCAASFCCVFRAAGVGGVTDTHALITPTTRGLRDLLKRDDVGFTLPLRPTQHAAADTSTESPPGDSSLASDDSGPKEQAGGGEEAEEEGSDDDEDAERWLQRMGIAPAAVTGVQSGRRQRRRQEQEVDGRAASTALVQGGDVYALLNFLLNSRACLTASGPLAGVPPTLLAPTAFRGASLQPLKVRLGTAQQGRQSYHSFELSGPVLPHAVQALVSLVRRSHPSFSLSLAGVRGTDALSQVRPPGAQAAPAVFGQRGLTDCGLDEHLVALLCRPQPATLREVRCDSGLFQW